MEEISSSCEGKEGGLGGEKAWPGGIFVPNSTSVVVSSILTHESLATVTDRLYRNQKKAVVKKTANDALLSSLPTDSLRWIKRRRKINSFEKVVLQNFRERQLRSIFNGLDFDQMGTIHLDLVKGAANYAEEKLKPRKGKPVFTNIQGMFAAMDEDGDGTVDFHEFTIAMTGSSKSAMDNATEQDVEKLTRRFIEYANIRRRERAVEEVKFPMSQVQAIAKEKARAPTPRDPRTGLPLLGDSLPDYERYLHFRTLFSIGAQVTEGETVESIHNVVEKAQKILANAASTERKTPKERLMDEFYGEMARMRTDELNELDPELDTTPSLLEARQARERVFEEVEKRVREARLKEEEEVRRDPEVRELHERIREEKRYLAVMKRSPWLPPASATAVSVKPTTVPPLPLPAKREILARLAATAEFIDARPRSPERRNGVPLGPVKTRPLSKFVQNSHSAQTFQRTSLANLRYNSANF